MDEINFYELENRCYFNSEKQVTDFLCYPLKYNELFDSASKIDSEEMIMSIFNNKGEYSNYDENNRYHVFWKINYYKFIEEDYEKIYELCYDAINKFRNINYCLNYVSTVVKLKNEKESCDILIRFYNEIFEMSLNNFDCLSKLICEKLGDILLENSECYEKIFNFYENKKEKDNNMNIFKIYILEYLISDELEEYINKLLENKSFFLMIILLKFYCRNKNFTKCIEFYRENKEYFKENIDKRTNILENIYNMFLRNDKNVCSEERNEFFEENIDKSINLCTIHIMNLLEQKNCDVEKIINIISRCNDIYDTKLFNYYKIRLCSLKKITFNKTDLEEYCSIVNHNIIKSIGERKLQCSILTKKSRENIILAGMKFCSLNIIKIFIKNYLEQIKEKNILLNNYDFDMLDYYYKIAKNKIKQDKNNEINEIEDMIYIFYCFMNIHEKVEQLKSEILKKQNDVTYAYMNYLKNNFENNELIEKVDEVINFPKDKICYERCLSLACKIYCEKLLKTEYFDKIVRTYILFYKDVYKNHINCSESGCITKEINNKIMEEILIFKINISEEQIKNIIENIYEMYICEGYTKNNSHKRYNFKTNVKIEEPFIHVVTELLLQELSPLDKIKYMEDIFEEDNDFLKIYTEKITSSKTYNYFKKKCKKVKKQCMICFEDSETIVSFTCNYNHFVCDKCYFKYPRCPQCRNSEKIKTNEEQQQQQLSERGIIRLPSNIPINANAIGQMLVNVLNNATQQENHHE